MRFRTAALTIAALIAMAWGSASGSLAGPVAEHAARAESLLEGGEADKAVEALHEAVAALWEESPLVIRKALLVESSNGLGIYVPREDAAFAPGDKVLLYVEPWGFGYGRSGDVFAINLKLGLGIETPDGQVLAEQPDLFRVDVRSRDRYQAFSLALSFVMPDLKKSGDFIFDFTLDDQNSAKKARFRLPFTVAAAAADTPVAESAAETNKAGSPAPR